MALNGGTSWQRGGRCKFDKILDVQEIITKEGTDIIKSVENFNVVLSDIMNRMNRLEKGGIATQQASDGPGLEELRRKFDQFLASLESDELRGPSGPVGPAGPTGPRGPKVDKLQDIKDVDLSGLKEGSVLVYRNGKWRPEVPVEETEEEE